MIKGAIFDMDGVVLDSMGIWQDLGKRFLAQNGKTAKDNLNDILYDLSLDEGADYMIEEYNLELTREEAVTQINKIIEDFYFNEVCLKDGMAELIKSLDGKGIPMSIATSSPKEHIEKALERNGVLQYFKGIITPVEAGESKRSPKIYNMAAELIGSSPAETFVFEDSAFCLETVKNAGYITIGVNDSQGGENQEKIKSLCDYYIENTAYAEMILGELI